MRRRPRRRSSPLTGLIIALVIFLVMGGIFAGLTAGELSRRHDKAWTYQQVDFVHCQYDHRSKSTYYWDCELADPGTQQVIYAGSVSTSDHSSHYPPGYGSRWLHRTDGVVDEVKAKFPLWAWFFLLIPLIIVILTARQVIRVKRYGLSARNWQSGPAMRHHRQTGSYPDWHQPLAPMPGAVPPPMPPMPPGQYYGQQPPQP